MRWLGYLWRIAANLFYMLVVFAVLIGIRDPMEKSIISVLGIIYTTVRSETPPSLTLRRSLVRVWFARSRGRPIGGNACAGPKPSPAHFFRIGSGDWVSIRPQRCFLPSCS